VLDVREQYIRAMYDLSKRAPGEWATFVEAFKALTVYELERMTSAPVDAAAVAIGMGRRIRELRDEFIDIEAMAHKIRK
jgi:hypothetical protein